MSSSKGKRKKQEEATPTASEFEILEQVAKFLTTLLYSRSSIRETILEGEIVDDVSAESEAESAESDEGFTDITALDPNDSMFQPGSGDNRIMPSAEPLSTRSSASSSKKVTFSTATDIRTTRSQTQPEMSIPNNSSQSTDPSSFGDLNAAFDTSPSSTQQSKRGRSRSERGGTPSRRGGRGGSKSKRIKDGTDPIASPGVERLAQISDLPQSTDDAVDQANIRSLEPSSNALSKQKGRAKTADKIQMSNKRQVDPSQSGNAQEDKGKRRREYSPEWDESAWQDSAVKEKNGTVGDEQEVENLKCALAQSLEDARRANAQHVQGEASTSSNIRHRATSVPTTPVQSLPGTPPLSSPTPSPHGTGLNTPSSRRTFAQARQQITGVESRVGSRPGRDPNEYRVRSLPATSEVDNPVLQDELLADQYVGLPNLTLGAFVPWSTLRGSGQFRFSFWGDECPDMDFETALNFMNFVQSGRYINPSRASPMITRAVRTTVNGLRMNLYVGDEPAILLSAIYVRQSYILRPPDRGLRQRSIGGIGHTQEWERQVSFICMAFGQPELRAQLSADVLSFTTRTDSAQGHVSTRGHFSTIQSPSIRMSASSPSPMLRSDGMSLDYNERIPVYDARNNPIDMSNVDDIFGLPAFEGEVPTGSFAVVGYTTNAYLSNRDHSWHVSCNVRFIVVIGTPVENVEEQDTADG